MKQVIKKPYTKPTLAEISPGSKKYVHVMTLLDKGLLTEIHPNINQNKETNYEIIEKGDFNCYCRANDTELTADTSFH